MSKSFDLLNFLTHPWGGSHKVVATACIRCLSLTRLVLFAGVVRVNAESGWFWLPFSVTGVICHETCWLTALSGRCLGRPLESLFFRADFLAVCLWSRFRVVHECIFYCSSLKSIVRVTRLFVRYDHALSRSLMHKHTVVRGSLRLSAVFDNEKANINLAQGLCTYSTYVHPDAQRKQSHNYNGCCHLLIGREQGRSIDCSPLSPAGRWCSSLYSNRWRSMVQ